MKFGAAEVPLQLKGDCLLLMHLIVEMGEQLVAADASVGLVVRVAVLRCRQRCSSSC